MVRCRPRLLGFTISIRVPLIFFLKNRINVVFILIPWYLFIMYMPITGLMISFWSLSLFLCLHINYKIEQDVYN